MSNQFIDTESGNHDGGTAARDTFEGSGYGGLQFTTPYDTCTVCQIQHQRTGTMTAPLRGVSTSLLATGGRKDVIGDEPSGGTSSRYHQGHDTRNAPPTTMEQMRMFVQAKPIPDGDMLLIDVTLKKEDYGIPCYSWFVRLLQEHGKGNSRTHQKVWSCTR